MGVPFYGQRLAVANLFVLAALVSQGRHSRNGEWTTYEDLVHDLAELGCGNYVVSLSRCQVQKHWPLKPDLDSVGAVDQG